MTTDIHALIAAAKQTSHRDSHSMDKVLCDHAIAMAEALANIKDNGCPRDAFVANRVLSQIVEEAKR